MTVPINSTSANIPSIAATQQGSAPTTPPAGFSQVYVDTNGALFTVGSNGVPLRIGGLAIGTQCTNLSTFSVTDSFVTWTNIGFDSEVWKNGVTHSTVTNNQNFTITVAGIYLVACYTQIATGGNTGGMGVRVTQNGNQVGANQINNQGTSGNNYQSLYGFSALIKCAVNDVLVFSAIQKSGSNQTYAATGTDCYIGWLGD